MIAPYLDQLSKRAQNVKVIQVDIDQVKSSQPYSKTFRISPVQTFQIRLSVESKKIQSKHACFCHGSGIAGVLFKKQLRSQSFLALNTVYRNNSLRGTFPA
jgi:hypothetical protein